ncbi:hypothetical protein [uncultured Friedmanniella sp.]|uniref:hypothetical protein n=1 Tax=uncultured Friedmanniella sp. TaxID=335381 RepID=UPI0035CC79CB
MVSSTTHVVGVLRRYSRQPHLWRIAKRVQKILDERPQPIEEIGPDQMRHVHKLEHRLDPATLAALVDDYAAGMSSTELQEKYSLGKASVLRLLAEAGVEMRRRSLKPEQVTRVVERYQAGLDIRGVAAEMGLPKTTVQDALRRSGTKMRTGGRQRRGD